MNGINISPFKRRSSSASKTAHTPPALTIPPRPVYSSAISESPTIHIDHAFASPYTPSSARDPLLPLSEEPMPQPFESTGSRAPLLRGSPGMTSPEDVRDDASSFRMYEDDSPRRFPPAEPIKTQTTPLRMPPPGVHDTYAAQYHTPLDAGPTIARPAPLMRSSSMPGVPQNGLAASLLPHPSVGVKEENVEGELIFEVFDAQFEHGADHMAKILKGHLAEVLKMQDEVGKMHLGLEGLRAPARAEGEEKTSGAEGEEKALEKREEGVEEIMQRLGALSDELRRYHSLGTPKLTFPKQGTDAKHHSRSQSVDARDTPPRTSPTSPKRSPEANIPRAQSNLDKLTAGLNIDIPDSLKGSSPEYTVLQSPPDLRRPDNQRSPKTPTSEGYSLAQQATKRSLTQAWDKGEKDPAESEWVENVRKGLDKAGSTNKRAA